MYQVLYRKWRPKTFSDVSGQPHIVAALRNEIRESRPAHAYLFIGSRGTGKTSCAKILAKAVNCLSPVDGDPCNECENCRGIDSGAVMDVVEIDAASNNGVDSIRELREAVNFTPAVAKYRVYIIDEVHMLSDGAFNALLKTLEEPPPHVIFILATTEAHKLPATILSRCQRFDFSRIAPEDIAARLQTIAGGEHFTLTPDAAMLLARLADGAMRDALSLCDQCLSRSRDITADVVATATGLAGREHLYELSQAVRKKDGGAALAVIDRLYNASQDMARLLSEWLEFYRELMLCKSVQRPQDIIVSTEAELARLIEEAKGYDLPGVLYAMEILQKAASRLQTGGDRRLETEMAALRLCDTSLDSSTAALNARIEALEHALNRLSAGLPVAAATTSEIAAPIAQAPSTPEPTPVAVTQGPVVADPVPPEAPPLPDEPPVPSETTVPSTDASADEQPFRAWRDVLDRLRISSPPLFGVLEHTDAAITDTHIIIHTDNPLFKVLLTSNAANKAALFAAIADVTGRHYRIGIRAPKAEEDAPSDDPLEALLRDCEQHGVPVNRE